MAWNLTAVDTGLESAEKVVEVYVQNINMAPGPAAFDFIDEIGWSGEVSAEFARAVAVAEMGLFDPEITCMLVTERRPFV